MNRRYIDPLKEFGAQLLDVEKPARYLGGEYGRLAKKDTPSDALFQTVIAFPDLYEIGMSNQAMRIIYNRLNSMEGISCDRAFVPAPDFENLLREKMVPLYGLDTGLCLKDTELLLFTLSYELGITNVLTMLDLAGIPLHAEDRGGEDPIVIMGGPSVSNPLPYSRFVDFFWIGEAEGSVNGFTASMKQTAGLPISAGFDEADRRSASFFELVYEAREQKKNGAARDELKALFTAHPSMWTAGKKEAVRAVDGDFSFRKPFPAVFPVPSMKVVQHHGSVEIMRGCPNGCRFCHAGFWYRPMRQKNAQTVMAEAAAFINDGGYREISLSSLSTGDYKFIDILVESLNRKYGDQHISFQLPSLRVSGFSLPLLEKISEVRKSGLTFAVETPDDFWQLSINKKVSLSSVVSILKEAKKNGWRGAKFYFMIGLPLACPNSGIEEKGEDEAIVNFVLEAGRQTGMHFNINIGTFVPKPHTPFQWAAQLNPEEAGSRLNYIREKLKSKGHRVGIQDSFVSMIEGVLSRGDERAGGLIEEAWKKGARLDSWNEFFKRNIWEEIFNNSASLVSEFMNSRPGSCTLPWDFIKTGMSDSFLKKDLKKSEARELTLPCMNNCNLCGICSKKEKVVVKNTIHDEDLLDVSNNQVLIVKGEPLREMLFTFSKEGIGVFYPHLTLIEIFAMALVRAKIPVVYTAGFNPLPRLEIASPLAMGIESAGETALIELTKPFDPVLFRELMNKRLPEGVKILDALSLNVPQGKKKYSLSALLYGAVYENKNSAPDIVPFGNEKEYRVARMADSKKNFFDLKRTAILAFDPLDAEKTPVSYFDLFKKLYH